MVTGAVLSDLLSLEKASLRKVTTFANGQEDFEQHRVCSSPSETSCFLLYVLMKLVKVNGEGNYREREAGWGESSR